jgi:hypothetical protein
MCLMLYLGTNGDVPLRTAPDLSVEDVESSGEAVRQWFSLPTVHFIGAVELYPVWNNNEHLPPKGTVEVSVGSVNPETFLFTEQFFYRVVA